MQKNAVFLLILIFSFFFGQSETHLHDVLFIDSEHGWIQANDNRIYITRDGGDGWIESYGPEGRLYFHDEMTGWIISGEYTFQSIDGGEQWTEKEHFAGHNLAGIVEHNDFYYLFGSDTNSSGVIYKSHIDSLNWKNTEINSQRNFWQIKDLKFSGQIGYASNGVTVYKTDNLNSWYELPVDLNESDDFGYGNQGRLQIISRDTVIVQKMKWGVYPIYAFAYTIDQGENWSDYPHLKWAWSNHEFYFISLKTGWATIDSFLVKTDNYGADWDTLLTTHDWFLSLSFIDSLEAWAVNGSDVFYTNDGWESYEIKTSVITRIDDSKTKPSQFSLHQNYPNPFNSSTTIEFELDSGKNVELSVHDISGKRISVILSEYRSQGKHAVYYNGENLASGIYFYRLMSGSQNEIRKMLLLK